MTTTILVLANQTAASDHLFEVLKERASKADTRLEFLAPSGRPGQAALADAQARLDAALARAQESDLEATGRVAIGDALSAVIEAYDPRRHDEIIVSTLPASTSHWMRIDLPARVQKATDAIVTHVEVPEPKPEPHYEHVEPPEPPGVLSPLRVLGWGGRPPQDH